MGFLINNMAEMLLVAGLILLVIEVLVLGFSTFFLLFVGLGLISTSLIFFTGVVDETFLNALILVSIVSSLMTAFLWKPLKKMQNTSTPSTVKSDLIGYRFVLDEQLAAGASIDHQYSGINWKVSSDVGIPRGNEVDVTSVSVGKMKVKIPTE